MIDAEINKRIFSAVSAWEKGDVYSAWKVIGDVCEAPWVNEVLETLDLREPMVQKRTLEEEARWQDERARKIRSDIEKELSKVSSVDGDPPLIKETVKSLNQFLEAVDGDDPAIAWLRDSARNTVERLNEASESPLKVAILGEFSSGKSRLINALLGEKILSIGLVPVTRSVTRIVYGEEIRVTVKHLDGTTVEVAADQLKAYTDERKKEDGASEVEEVILKYPAPLLKQVEIWDTPGFNSNNQLHDQVAAQLMLEADAVLWVIAAHQVGSRSETKLLETVKRAQGKVVGVLNQIDRLDDDQAITKQVAEVKKHYAKTVEEVVPTSAKWLEQDHPGGNREPLLAHIDTIGAWSQEQRQRRTARRVAAVVAKTQAYLGIQKEEALEREKQLKNLKNMSSTRLKTAMGNWLEVVEHRQQTFGATSGPEDKSFKTIATKQPLIEVYELLFFAKTRDLFGVLSEMLWVLEEVHWNLNSPWKIDFKIMVRELTNAIRPIEEKLAGEQDNAQSQLKYMDQLISLLGEKDGIVPIRITGQLTPSGSRLHNRLTHFTTLPTKDELCKWREELNKAIQFRWFGQGYRFSEQPMPSLQQGALDSIEICAGSPHSRQLMIWLLSGKAIEMLIPEIEKIRLLLQDHPEAKNDLVEAKERLTFLKALPRSNNSEKERTNTEIRKLKSELITINEDQKYKDAKGTFEFWKTTADEDAESKLLGHGCAGAVLVFLLGCAIDPEIAAILGVIAGFVLLMILPSMSKAYMSINSRKLHVSDKLRQIEGKQSEENNRSKNIRILENKIELLRPISQLPGLLERYKKSLEQLNQIN